MGLAIAQIQFLTLTTRKADCEFGITMDSMHKMALTREMSLLTSEYNSRLQAKNLTYFANGEYKPIDYGYVMGGDQYYLSSDKPLKDHNNMILTDYKGKVIMSDTYANALTAVLGNNCLDTQGRGKTFSPDLIPQILAQLIHGIDAEQIKTIIDGKKLEDTQCSFDYQNSMTGESVNRSALKNINTTDHFKALIDFYYPIFIAAANNGWTIEYNNQMNRDHADYNSNYVSDALISGTFQIMQTDTNGNYDIDTSLEYFITADKVEERSDSNKREELNAWYEAEKTRIAEKETLIDLHIDELSTELEAIKTEMDSIKTFIDDAVKSVFDWGGG